MIECQKIRFGRGADGSGQVKRREPGCDGGERRGIKTRTAQHRAERIDVVRRRCPSLQGGLEGCRASAGKRVVDAVAGGSQTLDEEAWQLGFETGAITDLVQAMAASLASSPEGIDKIGKSGFL